MRRSGEAVVVYLLVFSLSSLTAGRKAKYSLGLSSHTERAALSCPPCKEIHCTPKKASKLKCKGGITHGVCDCCPVCAKLEGEPCGGEWNYLGKCDTGLYCEAQKNPNPYGPKNEDVLVGKCKTNPRHAGDEAIPGYCQPKCTPKFCKANPKEICSAVDVAEVKQECQGECQHTSCQACRFADYDPDCIKCSKDDFSCMKKYAKCVKKQYCTRNKFPCRKAAYRLKEAGKFQCMVPPCLKH